MTETGSRPAAAAGIIGAVTTAIAASTGSALVGLYLCGSLATGDFNERTSDIDLLAVVSVEISADLAAHLKRMHDQLGDGNPTWRGRVEVVYVSAAGLANFRVASPRIAVISPGEPFHVISAGTDWLLTWYPARVNGIALVGPPVTEVVPDISFKEYGDAIRNQMRHFVEGIADGATPGSQA